ncbi:MAG: hypothetical protein IVW57_18335, partial [Ktedonobacterales bacterium]|nr:hypothetical protein [Ktedonobacterales bacterium]
RLPKPGFLATPDFGERLSFILAAPALLVGIAPQVLLAAGGIADESNLLPADAASRGVLPQTLGYRVGTSQWLPTAGWIALVLIVAVFAALRSGSVRTISPVYRAGQAAPSATTSSTTASSATTPSATALSERAPMTEAGVTAEESGDISPAAPVDVWHDLAPVFRSSWALPGIDWLLSGVEDESDEEGTLDEATDEDETDAVAAPDETAGPSAGGPGATRITPSKTTTATRGAENTGGPA